MERLKLLPPALLALTACTAPSNADWDPSAEIEFTALERRVVEARAFRLASECPMETVDPGGQTVRENVATEAGFEEGDLFRIVISVQGGQAKALSMQSDGREIKVGTEQGVLVEGTSAAFRRFFFRAGFIAASRAGSGSARLDTPAAIDAAFPASNVHYGEHGRIGNRDAKSILYRLRPPGALPLEVTLWLDRNTRVPLRRDFRTLTGIVYAETFTAWDPSPSFPDGHFDLPPKGK